MSTLGKGPTVAGTNNPGFSASNIIANGPFTMPEDGTATAIHFYTDLTTGNSQLAIYLDDGGTPTSAPSTRLAISNTASYTGAAGMQWRSKTISLFISNGTKIWLVEASDTSRGIQYDADTGFGAYNNAFSGTFPVPATFPTPTANRWNTGVNIYIDYTAGSPPAGGLFRPSSALSGLGTGGPFFSDPLA